MLDFQRPTEGSIRVLGLDSRRDSVEIHRRTGYLPGDLQLFPKLTGRDHVETFARVRGGMASMVDEYRRARAAVRHRARPTRA